MNSFRYTKRLYAHLLHSKGHQHVPTFISGFLFLPSISNAYFNSYIFTMSNKTVPSKRAFPWETSVNAKPKLIKAPGNPYPFNTLELDQSSTKEATKRTLGKASSRSRVQKGAKKKSTGDKKTFNVELAKMIADPALHAKEPDEVPKKYLGNWTTKDVQLNATYFKIAKAFINTYPNMKIIYQNEGKSMEYVAEEHKELIQDFEFLVEDTMYDWVKKKITNMGILSILDAPQADSIIQDYRGLTESRIQISPGKAISVQLTEGKRVLSFIQLLTLIIRYEMAVRDGKSDTYFPNEHHLKSGAKEAISVGGNKEDEEREE